MKLIKRNIHFIVDYLCDYVTLSFLNSLHYDIIELSQTQRVFFIFASPIRDFWDFYEIVTPIYAESKNRKIIKLWAPTKSVDLWKRTQPTNYCATENAKSCGASSIDRCCATFKPVEIKEKKCASPTTERMLK